MVLPQDILMKHGISTEQIFQKKNSKSLENAIYDVACLARLHLHKVCNNEKFNLIFIDL